MSKRKKQRPPIVLYERVRRCKYCNSDMTDTVMPRSYEENPFCNGCLNERLEKASQKIGPGRRELMANGYMRFVPDSESKE